MTLLLCLLSVHFLHGIHTQLPKATAKCICVLWICWNKLLRYKSKYKASSIWITCVLITHMYPHIQHHTFGKIVYRNRAQRSMLIQALLIICTQKFKDCLISKWWLICSQTLKSFITLKIKNYSTSKVFSINEKLSIYKRAKYVNRIEN